MDFVWGKLNLRKKWLPHSYMADKWQSQPVNKERSLWRQCPGFFHGTMLHLWPLPHLGYTATISSLVFLYPVFLFPTHSPDGSKLNFLKHCIGLTQHWLASLWYCGSILFVWHLMVSRINLLRDLRQIVFCHKLTQANLLYYINKRLFTNYWVVFCCYCRGERKISVASNSERWATCSFWKPYYQVVCHNESKSQTEIYYMLNIFINKQAKPVIQLVSSVKSQILILLDTLPTPLPEKLTLSK